MSETLEPSDLEPFLERLAGEPAGVAPGGSGGRGRQPVHTVYGGAHLFRHDTARRLGEIALASLETYAPEWVVFGRLLGLVSGTELPRPVDEVEAALDADDEAFCAAHRDLWLARTVYRRVVSKLQREPVEDFRIDFEDGYGVRSEAEEDGHAVSAAQEVLEGLRQGSLPPFVGIRIRPLGGESAARALRTLDRFLTALAAQPDGIPPGFVVTLPKVNGPTEVAVLAEVLDRLEKRLRLPRRIEIELMIETPRSVIGSDGSIGAARLVAAANGRCRGAHFGTYDYTASLEITAAHQHMTHPACDFARHLLQVSLAGTGVWLSDGATNVLPVPPHRREEEGPELSAQQLEENRAAVERAWRLHYDHVLHSLSHGYYQGWDLHPAQLVTRYAAVYAFFLQGITAAAERLRSFVEAAARATLVGDVFDDAATGQGLLNFFLRAVNCGALAMEELPRLTGLRGDEIETRSFTQILHRRTNR